MVGVIKDKNNSRLGEIKVDGSKFKAVGRQNQTLGHYDPKTNRTTDSTGATLAYGDILSALIWESR